MSFLVQSTKFFNIIPKAALAVLTTVFIIGLFGGPGLSLKFKSKCGAQHIL